MLDGNMSSMARAQQSQGRPAKGPFLGGMGFKTQIVKIIRNEGTASEEVTEAWAHIQPKGGYFELGAPVFEGDVVEVEDLRRGPGGVERRLAAQVDVNDTGSPQVSHIHVHWGKAPARWVAPLRRLTFENLHPDVQSVAGDLFADGHYEAAVQEAIKSLDVRVRSITGIDKSGVALMLAAFRAANPKIDVSRHPGKSGDDEKQGFEAIFRGVALGLRNPGAHELFAEGDPQQALEYLGLVSLLHRRIDDAKVRADD